MLVRLLSREFDEVVAVTDGQQAVDKVLQKPPNYFSMIILDINMPQKDGVRACIDITDYFDDQKGLKKGIEIKKTSKFGSNALSQPNNVKSENLFKD